MDHLKNRKHKLNVFFCNFRQKVKKKDNDTPLDKLHGAHRLFEPTKTQDNFPDISNNTNDTFH